MTRTRGGPELLLRTSSGRDLIQWRSPSGIQTHDVGRHLLGLPIIEGDPIRVGGQWQNRPNQHGLYFWQRTGQHIWYESALEAACLVALDQAGGVDKVAAQPFRLLFRTDAKSVRHDPDFFAIHRNGDQVVYDVKPLARMSAKARARFAGWRPRSGVNERTGVGSLQDRQVIEGRTHARACSSIARRPYPWPHR